MVLNSEVLEIKGDKDVDSIVVRNSETKKKTEIKVDGIFIEIGFLAKTDFISDLVDINDKKEIVVDNNSNTSQLGIFACGDVTNSNYKQVVISAGEGAKAALQAYKFLKLKDGQKIPPDWEKKDD